MKDAIDFLDSIEDHGYGGMAAYEIARATVRDASNHIAALVEILVDKPCPYDARCTIGECQQCGCSEGLLVNKRDLTKMEGGR